MWLINTFISEFYKINSLRQHHSQLNTLWIQAPSSVFKIWIQTWFLELQEKLNLMNKTTCSCFKKFQQRHEKDNEEAKRHLEFVKNVCERGGWSKITTRSKEMLNFNGINWSLLVRHLVIEGFSSRNVQEITCSEEKELWHQEFSEWSWNIWIPSFLEGFSKWSWMLTILELLLCTTFNGEK